MSIGNEKKGKKEVSKFTLSAPGVGRGLTASTPAYSFKKEIVPKYSLACLSTVENHLSVVVLTYWIL